MSRLGSLGRGGHHCQEFLFKIQLFSTILHYFQLSIYIFKRKILKLPLQIFQLGLIAQRITIDARDEVLVELDVAQLTGPLEHLSRHGRQTVFAEISENENNWNIFSKLKYQMLKRSWTRALPAPPPSRAFGARGQGHRQGTGPRAWGPQQTNMNPPLPEPSQANKGRNTCYTPLTAHLTEPNFRISYIDLKSPSDIW